MAHELRELAITLEARLDDPRETLEFLRDAVAKDQRPNQTFAALHDAARRCGKVAQLAEAYELLTKPSKVMALSGEQQSFFLLQAALFFRNYHGDLGSAAKYAEQSLFASPINEAACTALEDLLRDPDHHPRLSRIYYEASMAEKDPTRQLALVTRASELALELPQNDLLAIDVLSRHVKLDPFALVEREALFERMIVVGKRDEAIELMETALVEGGGMEREDILRARERLLALYLEQSQPAKAIVHIEELLRGDAEHEGAMYAAKALLNHRTLSLRAAAALSDAYEAAGKTQATISMLNFELQRVRGPRRVEVQRRLGLLKADRLKDPAGALEIIGPVVAADPSDDRLRRRFIQLSLSLEQPTQAARLLARALQGSKDPAVRARVGADVGDIYLKIGDHKHALPVLQQVVDAGGDGPAVLFAAQQLAELYGEAGQLKQLARTLELVIKLEQDDDARQAAARRLARLCEGPVRDEARAIVGYKALLGSPWTDEALGRLEALYEKRDDQEGLADVYAHRAERCSDADEARALALKAAELRVNRARNRAAALSAWKELRKKYGGSHDVHEKMLPLLEQEKDWSELASVLEEELKVAEDAPQKKSLLSRLAQLRLNSLNDAPGALLAYREALSLDPEDAKTRGAIEKLLAVDEVALAAARVLQEVYRNEPPTVSQVRVLRVLGRKAEDMQERLSSLEQALGICQGPVPEPEWALSLAGDGLRVAVEHSPNLVSDWLSRVQSAAEKVGDPVKRARALTGAIGPKRVDSRDLFLVARAAGDALLASEDLDRAVDYYRRAAAFDPTPELVQRIDELLAKKGSPTERLALYQSALSREEQAPRRRELLHAMASLQRDQLQDPVAALATLDSLLTEDPKDFVAHLGLVDACVALGDEERAYNELLIAQSYVTGERQKTVLERLAQSCARRQDMPGALAHYQQLLNLGDLSDQTLESIANAAEAVNDMATLGEVLKRRLETVEDVQGRMGIHQRLGEVQRQNPESKDAALETFLSGARLAQSNALDEAAAALYEEVTREDPEHREAAERLFELRAKSHAWQKLGKPFGVLSKTLSTHELSELVLSIEEHVQDPRAISCFVELIDQLCSKKPDQQLERRLQLAKARVLAKDADCFDAALEIYREALESLGAEAEEEQQAFERLLDSQPPEKTLPQRRWFFAWKFQNATDPVAALFNWAQAEEALHKDQRKAIELYSRIIELDPERLEAYSELARLRAETGDADGALEALRVLQEKSEGDAQGEIELRMASLLVEVLGRPSDALDILARHLESNPTDSLALGIVRRTLHFPEVQARAAELMEKAAEASEGDAARAEVLELLLKAFAETNTPELKTARRRWLKRLLDSKSDDVQGSLRVALQAAEDEPSDVGLWQAAERLARTAQTPEPVADSYSRVITRPLAPADAEMLGQRMVDFYEEWFDDSDRIKSLLRHVLNIAPRTDWAFDRLKLAFNAAQRWQDLFELYDERLKVIAGEAKELDLLREAAMAAKDFAGDPERAIDYLERLYRLVPDEQTVQSALERLYERHQRRQQLIALLSAQLDKAEPAGVPVLRQRIAKLWIELRDCAPALELLEAMFKDDPDSELAVSLSEELMALQESKKAKVARKPAGKKGPKPTVRQRCAALLRDYYERHGATGDVVRVIQVQVDSSPADSDKVRGLREITDLGRQVLGDEALAFNSLCDLVRLSPETVDYRTELAELSAKLNGHKKQAELLCRVAEGDVDDDLRITLLCEAAVVFRTELGDFQRAIKLYHTVLELTDDTRPEALQAARGLDEMLDAAERHAERCGVLERLARLEPEIEGRQRALGEAARLALTYLDDVRRAIADWRLRLEADAADLVALNGLCQALETAKDWEALIEALQRRAEVAEQPRSKYQDLLRVARIYADELHDVHRAIAAYREVRQFDPKDLVSFDALVSLLSLAGHWVELAQLLREEADLETDPNRRAELLGRLGEVHRSRTLDLLSALLAFVEAGDWVRATEVAGASDAESELAQKVCRTLLDLAVKQWAQTDQPPDRPEAERPREAAAWAISELSQRLLEEGRHADVVSLLLEASSLPFDREKKRELLREAACLATDHLGENDRAIGIFKSLIEEDPADAVARSSVTRLALLLEEKERYEEIASLWEGQAACRAQADDASGAALLWARAAEISEERLGDLERAIRDYREGASRGGESSLEALVRIYLAQRRYSDAAEVLEWLCAQASRETLSERVLRLANAYVEAGDYATARHRLEQAAELVIEPGGIRKKLAELYRQESLFGDLSALLTLEADRVSDPQERLSFLREAADLHVNKRNAPAEAVPLLRQAVELAPDTVELRLSLADALTRSEEYDEAIQVLSDQIQRYGSRRPKGRAEVHYRLAQVLVSAGNPTEALAQLEFANRINPASAKVLGQLAQLSLQAEDLDRAERMFRALLLVLPTVGESATGRAEALLNLSEIAQKKADSTRANEFVESAFEAAATSTAEARHLEQALRARGATALLTRLLRTRLNQAKTPNELARALADLFALGAETTLSPDVAAELQQYAESTWSKLLDSDSEDAGAFLAMASGYKALGDTARHTRALERYVAVSGEELADTDALYQLAELKLSNPDTLEAGVDALNRALKLDPQPERALRMVKRALALGSAPLSLLETFEKLARAEDDVDTLLEALSYLVKVEERALSAAREGVALALAHGHAEQAKALLEQCLSTVSDVAPQESRFLRLELAKIYEDEGKIGLSLDLREQVAKLSDGSERYERLVEVARLAEQHGDLERAARLFEGLRAKRPIDRNAWEPLLKIYRSLGKTKQLVQVLEQTAPHVKTTEDRAVLRLEQANVLLNEAQQEHDAIRLYKEVLEEDPGQQAAAEQLAKILERLGRGNELIDIYTMRLESAKAQGNVEAIGAISAQLGQMLERADRPKDALATYRAALEYNAHSRDALRAVVRLSETLGDENEMADAIEALLRVESADASQDLVTRLLRIREAQRDWNGIERALSLGFAQNPADEALRDSLLLCYAKKGDHLASTNVLARAVAARSSDDQLIDRFVSELERCTDDAAALKILDDLCSSVSENAKLLRGRAQLLQRLGDKEQALEALERAFELEPEHPEALIAALRTAIEEGSLEVDGVLRLASVYEHAQDLQSAVHLLRKARAPGAAEGAILQRLSRLQSQLKDWLAATDSYLELSKLVEGEDLVEVALALAPVAECAGRLADARAALERALEVEPSNREVHHRLREIYKASGEDERLANMLLSTAESESDPEKRFSLLLEAGDLLTAAGNEGARAVEVLEAARAIEPADVRGAVLLARALSASGRQGDALELINELVAKHRGRRSKELCSLYQELSRVQLDRGDEKEGLMALRKAHDLEPKNATLAMRLGELSLALGEPNIALRAYRAVTMGKPDPSDPKSPTAAQKSEAHYQLAALASQQGEARKARILLAKALAENPDHKPAQSLRKELDARS